MSGLILESGIKEELISSTITIIDKITKLTDEEERALREYAEIRKKSEDSGRDTASCGQDRGEQRKEETDPVQ